MAGDKKQRTIADLMADADDMYIVKYQPRFVVIRFYDPKAALKFFDKVTASDEGWE